MYQRKVIISAIAGLLIVPVFVEDANAKFRIKISKRGIEVGPIKIPAPPQITILDGIAKGKSIEEIAKSVVKNEIDRASVTPIEQTKTLVEKIATEKMVKVLGKGAGDAVEVILFPTQIERKLKEATANVAKGLVDGDGPELILGIPLAAAISQAKDHYNSRSKPIPTQVKYLLSTTFSAGLLNNARYAVDDFGGNVPALINKLHESFGTAHAVTVDNIVVFSREPKNEEIFWWAHEMTHVEQYRAYGIEGFAARYSVDWNALEKAADAKAHLAQNNADNVLVVLNALAELQQD